MAKAHRPSHLITNEGGWPSDNVEYRLPRATETRAKEIIDNVEIVCHSICVIVINIYSIAIYICIVYMNGRTAKWRGRRRYEVS